MQGDDENGNVGNVCGASMVAKPTQFLSALSQPEERCDFFLESTIGK